MQLYKSALVHRVVFCNTELGEFKSSEMRFRPALRARLDSRPTSMRQSSRTSHLARHSCLRQLPHSDGPRGVKFRVGVA
jgi:hypothetical protein